MKKRINITINKSSMELKLKSGNRRDNFKGRRLN